MCCKCSLVSFFVILIIVIGCGYSNAEKSYLNELSIHYTDFDFKLTDRVTNLELTVNIGDAKFDSAYLETLFFDFKKPLSKYPSVSWVYLIVNNDKGYITSIGHNSRGKFFYFKGHEGQSAE